MYANFSNSTSDSIFFSLRINESQISNEKKSEEDENQK